VSICVDLCQPWRCVDQDGPFKGIPRDPAVEHARESKNVLDALERHSFGVDPLTADASETILLDWDFDPIDTAAGPAHRESAFGVERQPLEARPIALDDCELRAGA
jgi:hypothetical protein